ncbi:YdcF family protein [Rhodovibrionaceae bacterium A322]
MINRPSRSARNLPGVSGWLTRFFGAVLLVAVAFGAGLVWFAQQLPQAEPRPWKKIDALVVLTGGSDRLSRGLELLDFGLAEKALISGVYRGVEVGELLRLAQQDPTELSCCITLGYEADNTRGNAEETARWMQQQGYQQVRLVTAVYHMPRSLLEFKEAMPEMEIMPHPVFPAAFHAEDWWLWPGSTGLLASEFLKYLLAQGKYSLKGLLVSLSNLQE